MTSNNGEKACKESKKMQVAMTRELFAHVEVFQVVAEDSWLQGKLSRLHFQSNDILLQGD